MSLLFVAPELVSVAVSEVSSIGSTIAEANVLAAAPTLGVVAPAADSVSAELAALFGGHAKTYRAVSGQAELFHQAFVNNFSASSAAYTSAEAESAAELGKERTAKGVQLLGSRQHEIAANAGSRKWQSGRQALWRPGMSDPRLITPRHSLPDQARLWHPGLPGFNAHSLSAPRLFMPHQELMGGLINGSRGIVENTGGLIRQIIQNQISYLKLIATSLVDFVNDEIKAIIGLPAAFSHAIKALTMGNFKGAMDDIEKAFLRFLINGAEKINKYPGYWYEVAFTGALPDLWHLTQIPAEEMQNLADLLKPLGFGILGNMVQQLLADPLNNLADGWHMYISAAKDMPGFMLDKNLAMLFDILGAPILSLEAFEDSIQSSMDALLHGAPLRALVDFAKTPADIMHAFLFGDGYLKLPSIVADTGATLGCKVHLGGIFAPLNYGQEGADRYPFTQITDPNRGTLTGGLVPALVSMLPPKMQAPLLTIGAFLDGLIAALERHPASP